MLRKTFNLVSLLTISVFLLTGCGKDGDDSKSKTTLLTQRDWVRTSLTVQINSNPPSDEHNNQAACNRDNRWVFNANGTYEQNEGPTKCDPGYPQIVSSGPWSFSDNETKLIIGSNTFTIDQLTETTLGITYTYTTPVGGNTTVSKSTFAH